MVETKKKNNKRKKNNKSKLIILLFIVLIVLLGKTYYDKGFTAVGADDPKEINIEIPTGSSSSKISNILKKEGLIRNEFIFKMALKNKKADGKLKAGTYTLNTGMDIYSIVNELSKGGKNENVVRFTIPEGYEIHQMADKLAEENIVDKKMFLNLTSDKKNFQDSIYF